MAGKTRQVSVGGVRIGGGAPVSVQSMTNTDTADVEATLAQIRALAAAGADIVRISVYHEACAKAVRPLVDGSPVPLVADIHFDHRLALQAVENGIQKLRINPGNIGGEKNVRILADCVKAHHIPVRIGVNSGSVEREILQKYGGPTPQGMVESALSHARMLEKCGFYDMVLSMKASNVPDTVQAYRLASAQCDYPLHLGVTEAGLPEQGRMKSAIGIGALLLDGIGDTIRVSLTGDPCLEPPAGIEILQHVGLRKDCVQYVSCPTCGRTCIDVGGIMARVQRELADVHVPFKVAVMGCVVNGPGEAREADIGICGGGHGTGLLIKKGEAPRKVTGDLAQTLVDEIRKMLAAG
ncbi:MAG TPA: flavodoxin-dependent (E)-4-hydroxy-3-methylbut-2-enyl-diphosphate synthase [Candidatus Ventricola intestinavium]|nr:flavodoxin-dependent (E)-4-hydroxy-3-methylbut-2-enyl-diphosphate synthase [Candidatus Ventricola intestinavium]